MKTCFKCKASKPETEFYRNNQKKDGLSTYCKPCAIEIANARYVAHPRPRQPEGFKKCSRCKEIKPVAEFSSQRKNADGLSYYCKPCGVKNVMEWRKKKPGYHAAYQKRWYHEHAGYKPDNILKHKLGMEPGTYDKMLEAQNGRCAICQTTKPGGGNKRFHVDHCHDTGRVRGLLCTNCNVGIGQLKHDPNRLLAAIDYLNRN